jgi:hypothetical protein
MTESPFAPGTLLVAPAGSGPRASDVLCVFDHDRDEPGAVFALLLNRPTDRPAQPLAFALFDSGDGVVWWGGPTSDVFAIAKLRAVGDGDDSYRPDGRPRKFLTDRSAVFLPGSDHPPESEPEAVRIFSGSIWLPPQEVDLYRRKATVAPATDVVLFDDDPETLAARMRRAGA